MMFPVENMPWPLQLLSNAIPARWYILAVKKIMIKGLGVTSIIRETAVLAGMAVFLISLSLQRFKTRLE
jgi:ABC-2 type transport system permease protein